MHTPISTPAAPAAIGPYSQATAAAPGKLVFCSGQIALDPGSGELVGAGDASRQTERCLSNLCAVLAAAGAGPEHIVKTTIYLVDLQDFGSVNEIYSRFFGATQPARSTVEVKGLPRGALVEIEAIAVVA